MTSKIREIPPTGKTSLHYLEQLTLCKTPQDSSQQSPLYNEAILLTQRHVTLTTREEFHSMIPLPTNSNMANMRPTLSKNSNNLPFIILNINIDPTLQLSTNITLTNNESPKSPYQENLNLLTHISPLIPGTICYKLVTTSRIQPINSPLTQVNTTSLHLKENQYLSHECIIIHPPIIHLNNHISQLIPDLILHKLVTILLTYTSNFSLSQATTTSILLWENYALSHNPTSITSPLYSNLLSNINTNDSLLNPSPPRYKTCIFIVYYNVFITCHDVFFVNLNYVNNTHTITCLLIFITRRAPTIKRNISYQTPNKTETQMETAPSDVTYHHNFTSAQHKTPNPPTSQLLITGDTNVILTLLEQHCCRDLLSSSQTTYEDNISDNSPSNSSTCYQPHHRMVKRRTNYLLTKQLSDGKISATNKLSKDQQNINKAAFKPANQAPYTMDEPSPPYLHRNPQQQQCSPPPPLTNSTGAAVTRYPPRPRT